MGINDYIKIGSHIKAKRQLKGLTQREIATKLDIPYSTYSNYENNNREPDIDTLEKIVEILDITLDEFFAGALDLNMSGLDNATSPQTTPIYKLMGISKDAWENFGNTLDYLSYIGYDVIEVSGEEHNIFVLKKDGQEITFTEAEFEEFQLSIEKTIEFEMFKQKHKKEGDSDGN